MTPPSSMLHPQNCFRKSVSQDAYPPHERRSFTEAGKKLAYSFSLPYFKIKRDALALKNDSSFLLWFKWIFFFEFVGAEQLPRNPEWLWIFYFFSKFIRLFCADKTFLANLDVCLFIQFLLQFISALYVFPFNSSKNVLFLRPDCC